MVQHDRTLTYDGLGRLGWRRWFMPPVAISVALAGSLTASLAVFALAAASAAVLGFPVSLDSNILVSPSYTDFVTMAALGMIIPVVALTTRVVQRRPAGLLHSVQGHLRWRWFAVCLAVSVSVNAVMVTIMLLAGGTEEGRFVGLGKFLVFAGILVVLVPLQAAGEEYAARGFLLQTLGIYGRWIAVAGSSLAFALMHGIGSAEGFTVLFCGAVIWSLLVIRTGGLEVSIAAHASTNLMAFMMDAASGGLSSSADDVTAADASFSAALLLLGADLTYACLIVWVLRFLRGRHPTLYPDNTLQPGQLPIPVQAVKELELRRTEDLPATDRS